MEVTFLSTAVGLRDSKDKGNGPIPICTPDEWNTFIAEARDGESASRSPQYQTSGSPAFNT